MEFVHAPAFAWALEHREPPSAERLFARRRQRLQRVSISATRSIAAQVARLDRQLERTERLMRYEILIQMTNNIIMPRAADESGTG